MAFQVTDGDVIRAACRLRDGYGSDILNVYHFMYAGATTNSTVLGPFLINALDLMYDHIQPAIPSDTTFVDIDLSNATTGEVEAARAWQYQTAGGGTGAQMPSKDTALVVGRTNRSKVVGRKFLGPFISDTNVDGVWSSGFLTSLGDFLTDYLADVIVGAVGSLSPGVARYIAGVFNRFTLIDTGYCTNGIYSQRRRRPGVGS
jgi:hypothetical protein